MFSQKHSLLAAAVLASLSLTACGKKQDLYSAPPADAQKQAQTTEETPQTKTPKKKSSDTQTPPSSHGSPLSSNLGNLSGDGLQDDNSGQLPEPATPAPSKATPKNPYGPPSSGGRVGGGLTPAPVAPPAPRPRPEPAQPAPQPYEPADSSGRKLTGGTSKEGLSYTSSATDSLLDFLKARNAHVDENTRRANQALASSVNSASLMTRDGAATLTLKLVEDGQAKNYVLTGDVRAGTATKLSLSASATNGAKAADATLKCVDADGGCENMFARIRIGTPGSASILSVVFRNSGADLFFALPGTNSGSPEYLNLREFMRNTVAKQGDRITSSRLTSFEVVNGRSGFTLALTGNNGQSLAYAGPLVAATSGDADLNVALESKSRSDYANSITGARLISNNTLGRLQMRLQVESGELFTIKVSRQTKPLVTLSDDNLK